MKLTVPTLRVKSVSPAQVFIASLLTGLGLLLLWSITRDDEGNIDHFGGSLAASLASQVTEPLIAEDLIHLGVLANRIIELPAVTGSTILNADDKMLALSGDARRGRTFTAQVVHNGSAIGIVRIQIDEAQFSSSPTADVIVLSLLWICLVPFATLLAGNLVLPARRKITDPPGHVESSVVETEPEICYLIAVNLFNQLSLTPEQYAKELSFARLKAAQIADLYNGQVRDLPGTGLLLRFPGTDSDDRSFHVLCAGFALSKLLAEADRYRIGLHLLISNTEGASESCPAPGEDEWVADAAVLSAMAKNNTLVVSRALFERVPYNQRIHSEPMRHRLLDELETIGGGAYLAQSLAEPHDELVSQQVAELSYSARSTASESTF